VALGVIFFVLGCGAGVAFEDAGLSSNRLAQVLVFGLMWPPYLLMRAFGWFSYGGASTVSNSNLLGLLFSQLLGWGFLGIPVGLWRARQWPSASSE
jgi:hypothetical protein